MEGVLRKVLSPRKNDRLATTYALSSSSRRLMTSCTVESHRCAAEIRSLSTLKVCTVYVSI